MKPRQTEHLFTISTTLVPEQIEAVLRKVTAVEPTGPFTSYRRYGYSYEYYDSLFHGSLLPDGFALRRISLRPYLYPYIIGTFRETPSGTDIDVVFNRRHWKDLAALIGVVAGPMLPIYILGFFIDWWQDIGDFIFITALFSLPFVFYALLRRQFRSRVSQDRMVLERILVPASLESDRWVRNVINEGIWGSGKHGLRQVGSRVGSKNLRRKER